MDMKQFLLEVVPTDGVYYLGTVDKNGYREKALTTMTDVEAYIEKANKQHKDVYFATSSYNDTSSRGAVNVKNKKSLYLDLDCGEGKDFINKKDAVVRLVQFCKAIKLAAPNILVDSGNGIHAYWILSEVLTADAWLPIAIKLKDACISNEFPADMTVTADTARIMRIPGTRNYKGNADGKACKVIKTTGVTTDVDALKRTLNVGFSLSVVSDGIGGVSNDDLGGGLTDFIQKKFLAKNIIEECPTMQQIVLTGGEECTEPLWKQTLSLLSYCTDGEQYIHKVSEKHPAYTPQKTDNKYANCVKTAISGKYGPTTCATFAINPTSKCQSCPHNGEIKSPISLGKPLANELPYGYIQDKFGIFKLSNSDSDDAIPTLVSPYRIEDFSVKDSLECEGLMLDFKAIIGSGVELLVTFPQAVLNDKRTTANAASANGMVLTSKQAGEFILLMNTWTQQMQAARKVGQAVSNYGWVADGDRHGFSTNNKIFWEDGIEQKVSMAENVLAHQYKQTGSIEPWKKASKYIIDQNRPQLVCALASGFAAPLIKMTGVSGVMISIVSTQSGTGKSSALKTSQSIWGCPVRGINALNDTPNSIAKRLGALRNLPAYWDELRMKDEIDKFIKLTFQLGQGKEKSRLTQSTAMQDMGTWNTLITAASNESLYNHIIEALHTSNAGIVRVFEITFPEAEYKNDVANTQMMFKSLDNNYGHAGQVYGKYLAENRLEIAEKLDKLIVGLSSKLNASADERFWIGTIAALVSGASLANKCGLTNFNVPELTTYLLAEFNRMRSTGKEDIVDTKQSMRDLIERFINEHGAQVYGVGTIPSGKTTVEIGTLPQKFPVIAMVAADGGMRIRWLEFKSWAYDNGLWNNNIVSMLLASGVVKGRRSITNGLHIHNKNNSPVVLDIKPSVMDKLHSITTT